MTRRESRSASPFPLTGASADRVSDVLLALEIAPAVGFRLAALALVEGGVAQPAISVRLGDHAFRLTPAEARLTARCIGFEDKRRATGLLVSLFDSAACDAEAMAAGLARRQGLALGEGAAA